MSKARSQAKTQPQPRRGANRNSQPLRMYQSGKQYMELIASVSRSSGLEKGGDALRDFKLQEEYRQFIQGKVDDYWTRYPYGTPVEDPKHRDEMRGNILILFRKLREGLLSTKRSDLFSLEVYETSLYLSVIFASPAQTTSIVAHLTSLYTSQAQLSRNCQTTTLVSLLHFLVAAYPSHSRCFEHLHSLPRNFLPAHSEAERWLRQLTRTLRQGNYSRLERLTERAACTRFVDIHSTSKPAPGSAPEPSNKLSASAPVNLALEALCTLLDALRTKARESSWRILRSAYRELSCPKNTEDVLPEPHRWLLNTLALRPVALSDESREEAALVDAWIEKRCAMGDLRPKEGVEGRWIFCKAKS